MGNAGDLKCWFSTDSSTSNYRYFSIRDIESKLELKDFDVAIWLNPQTRNVIAIKGVSVDSVEYYRQYDLSGGQTLVEPVLDTNYTLTSGTDYFLYTYDNKAVVKFAKQYATVSYTINDSTTKTFSHVSEIELPYSGKYKIEVVGVSGVPKSADNIMVTIVNKPMLVDGMTPVKLNNNNTPSNPNDDYFEDTTQNDPEWYNYDSSVKKWANVKLKDGSMYVWIPRYAYEIDSTNKAIKVKFLSEFSNIATSGKALESTYKVMPAFQNGYNNKFANGEWDNEITGFWVAKYETINNSGKPKNICTSSTQCWREITPANAFKTCRMMEADHKSNYFGDSVVSASGTLDYGVYPTDKNNIDTHLIKNSEWGAVAYLTWSEYGAGTAMLNKENYYINQHITAAYSSTAENITGIYGLSGGAHDMVAAGPNILNTSASPCYNSSNTSTKYATVYNNDISASTIYGDAMQETMTWGYNHGTLYTQLICRGGYITTATNGVLAYQNKNYDAADSVTFRPVIIVEY